MGPQTFNIGDTVRRLPGMGAPFHVMTVTAVRVTDDGRGTETRAVFCEGNGDWHHMSNLELVTRAEQIDMSTIIEVGDTVARMERGGSNGSRAAGEEFVVVRINSDDPDDTPYDDLYDANGEYHYRRNVRLVRKANAVLEPLADWEQELLREPGAHGFAVGDKVRRTGQYDAYSDSVYKRDDREWIVASLDSDDWPVDPAGRYHTPGNVERVLPTTEKAARKPGETPEGDHIGIDDPRIQWLWADLAEYADGQSWCRQYEQLAKVMGIPGRKRTWSGTVRLRGANIQYTDIEAETDEEARLIFHRQLISDLTPVNTDVPF